MNTTTSATRIRARVRAKCACVRRVTGKDFRRIILDELLLYYPSMLIILNEG